MSPARSLAIRLAVLVLLLPMTAAAQSTLADTLLSQTVANGEIPWSARRPLQWPDFRGRARQNGRTAAETVAGVAYLIRCQGEQTSTAVLASFSPARSWVRPEVPGSRTSERTLQHERTHFNIFELFARAVRRDFAQTPDICPHGIKAASERFNRIRKEYEGMQDRYDKESRHGLEATPQGAWNRLIAARLDSTASWSRR